jgi:hypothetical protein
MRGDVASSNGTPNGEQVTASQFAAMLVALLGGTPPESAPLPRTPMRALPEAGGESDGEPIADAMRPDSMQPIAPIDLLPPEFMQPIAPAPETVLPLPAVPLPAVPPPAQATLAGASLRPESTVERSVDGLSPLFRSRLQRVVDRMRTEFGHDVQLVETTRSADRQAWLFAQGRTRPGPVVTWTQHSAHLTGDAADVIIDGQWRNDLAYGRLHRVAEEEGLRTLGARDPGHLELPAAVRAAQVQLAERTMPTLPDSASAVAHAQMTAVAAQHAARAAARAARSRTGKSESNALPSVPTSTNTDATSMMSGDVATGVARVAESANVARVASVASVAGVARPGVGAATNGARVDSDLTLAQDTNARSGRAARARRDDDVAAAPTATSNITGFTLPTAAARETTPSRLASAIDRVDRANGIASRSPREVAQLTLNLDAGDGRKDEVTINVRGTAVGASVSTDDAATATRLRDNVIDLRRALEARGMSMDEWRADVRRTTEVTDPARVIASLDRDGLRLRASDAGDSAFSREGQRGRDDSSNQERGERRDGDTRHPFKEQDQRERQGAARDHAARIAAFRRAGRPLYGDDVA